MASAYCGYGFPLFTRLPLRVDFSETQLPIRSVLKTNSDRRGEKVAEA